MMNDSALSEHYWNMKDRGLEPSIRFSVLRKQKVYSPETKKCFLCIQEKMELIKVLDNPDNVNKKSELMGYCLHRYKSLLCNINLDKFVPNMDMKWFDTGQQENQNNQRFDQFNDEEGQLLTDTDPDIENSSIEVPNIEDTEKIQLRRLRSGRILR